MGHSSSPPPAGGGAATLINNIEMIIDILGTIYTILRGKKKKIPFPILLFFSISQNTLFHDLLSFEYIYIYIHIYEKQRCEMLGLELMGILRLYNTSHTILIIIIHIYLFYYYTLETP